MTSSPKQLLPDLFVLQQLDTKIQQAKRTQSNLDNGERAKLELAAAQSDLKVASSRYHSTHGSLRDNELKLSALETKLVSYRAKMYQGTITNPKELSNIEKEIASLERQRGDLDETILELMEQSEIDKRDEVAAAASASAAEVKFSTAVQEFKAKSQHFTETLQNLAEQRSIALVAIDDPKLLKRYDDLRARNSGTALVTIAEGRCDGCKMPLSGTIIKSAETEDVVSYCDNCGRMLVALSQLKRRSEQS